jgi:hypothetical protein
VPWLDPHFAFQYALQWPRGTGCVADNEPHRQPVVRKFRKERGYTGGARFASSPAHDRIDTPRPAIASFSGACPWHYGTRDKNMSLQTGGMPAMTLRTIFRTLLAASLGAAVMTAAGGAAAQEQEKEVVDHLLVRYDFNFGGFNMGGAELHTEFSDDAYEARSKLQTGGLAEAFFRSRYEIVSKGFLDGRLVKPISYDSHFKGVKGKYQYVTIDYRPDTWPILTRADPPYGKKIEKRPVPKEMKWNTVDPLSAWAYLVAGSTASDEEPCGRVIPIFDAVRRYDLELDYVESREDYRLGPSWGKATYEGKAYRCKMVYRRLAGFKNKDGRDFDELPIPALDLWMAPVGERGLLVPLRLVAHTEWGDVVLIAKNISVKKKERPALQVVAKCTSDVEKAPC